MKRKQFKSAVATAFGRHKTKGGSSSSAGKSSRKGDTFRKARSHDSARSQLLLRLNAQKKRLARATEKLDASDKLGHVQVHIEACKIFEAPARDGIEFAEEERLWHLRKIVENSEDHPEASEWRSELVIALLAAGEVKDARMVLQDSDTRSATGLAYSAALLAFIDAHKSVTETREDVDASGDTAASKEQSSDSDESSADVVALLQRDDSLSKSLRTAIGVNPYVADILSTLGTFTAITAPQQIDGARNIDRGVEYAGSVEEALAYIADAGMMWADRPGMEDWVAHGISQHGTKTSSCDPRSSFAKPRYKKLFVDNVAQAKKLRSGKSISTDPEE
eukprot:m.218455 g.218455  ORF g.218455 m.218455 type:complete len:335 (+) comp19155_c0_seq5:187-1191(+)